MFNIIQSVGKCKVVFSIAQRTNKIRFCRENRMKKSRKEKNKKKGCPQKQTADSFKHAEV